MSSDLKPATDANLFILMTKHFELKTGVRRMLTWQDFIGVCYEMHLVGPIITEDRLSEFFACLSLPELQRPESFTMNSLTLDRV